MKKYIVHKNSKTPGKISYAGVSWLNSKLRYEEQYSDREYALKVAEELSKHNPVGFKITEIDI